MLRRIVLENFMSHGRTEIDLADGLTVLTGPNNCGKSAVVAALQILASNGSTTHVLRHGESVCRITVETDDGHTVCWERKKTTVKYTIDGEDIHRVGRSVPDSLHEVLRLDRVKAEIGSTTHEYDIHFGEQKSPVFLLGETGSRAASFFASSSDASRLVEMQHRHRVKLREQRAAAKRLGKEIGEVTDRLVQFEPLTSVENQIETADSISKVLETSGQQIQQLMTAQAELTSRRENARIVKLECVVLSALDKAKTSPAKLQKGQQDEFRLKQSITELQKRTHQQQLQRTYTSTLAPLQSIPEQHDVASIRSLIQKLQTATQRKVNASAVLACCKSIAPPPALEPASSCQQYLERLQRASRDCARLTALSGTLGSLKIVPDLPETETLNLLITRLKSAEQKMRSAQLVSSAATKLVAPPQQEELTQLRQLIGRLYDSQHQTMRMTASCSTLQKLSAPIEQANPAALSDSILRLKNAEVVVEEKRREFEDFKRKVSDCKAQLVSFVKANPTCKTCGAEIDPDRLMAGVPGGHVHPEETDKHATAEHRSDDQ